MTSAVTNSESALRHLNDHGYVVIENVLPVSDVDEIRQAVEALMRREREAPFEPEDGPGSPDDAAIEAFLRAGYTVSEDELARLMRRIRHTRAASLQTPWPVAPDVLNKIFLHLPTLFDQDHSQRVWNLLNKGDVFARLVEHPNVLELVRKVLGVDCLLSDCSATSIGPCTGGGAWHVDVPLGQLSEPLPDFPLTMQNIWLLDDFTEENGATRVVPDSHKTRRKPQWAEERDEEERDAEEAILTAPAGSVAMWLSNTWHRSGPNLTDRPRRGVICYYCRSWVKPFNDFKAGVEPKKAAGYSDTVRYLMGYSAEGPVRG